MNDNGNENIFSKRLKAGKRRTYFFDVRATKGNDYFVTLTESKKKFNGDGYERHKIFLYKEDFNKFLEALTETIDHVKTDLMPDFDFDAFSHEDDDSYSDYLNSSSDRGYQSPTNTPAVSSPVEHEEVDPMNETPAQDDAPHENPSKNDDAEMW